TPTAPNPRAAHETVAPPSWPAPRRASSPPLSAPASLGCDRADQHVVASRELPRFPSPTSRRYARQEYTHCQLLHHYCLFRPCHRHTRYPRLSYAKGARQTNGDQVCLLAFASERRELPTHNA